MAAQLTELSKEILQRNGDYDGHYRVWHFTEPRTKLSGYIAIHRKRRGKPSLGGTRFYPYASKSGALTDVLRLSRAMSYKCAVSGLPYGGGKAVIIGDPQKIKTPELLRSYALVVDSLKGQFRTGEDVGTSEDDVQYMLTFSEYFVGKRGEAGDPSPYAALSVFTILKEAITIISTKKPFTRPTVRVRGVGKVGSALAELADAAGMKVVVADISRKAINTIKKKIPNVLSVPVGGITQFPTDIYSPCAVGTEFTFDSISDLGSVKIICGGANNQLSSNAIAESFFLAGILYVPDYLANAGGLIDVADELEPGGYQRARVYKKIKNLKIVFRKLHKESVRRKESLQRTTERYARKIVNK